MISAKASQKELRDFHEGFELLKSAQSGKIVLDWAA